MKSAVVDKIASVAQHNDLTAELRLSPEIPCEEGVLVAARVLNNKSRYNQLELTSGRMATVNQGDVVVGALGHRKALRGYSGHLPTELKPGDTIQLLNIGGVLGLCDSANPDVGPPFDCEVLGTVLSFPYLGERIGVPARAGADTLDDDEVLDSNDVPVIAMAGTCMDSGKTAAACAIVGRLRHLGFKVSACKATGVSLRRDVLAMEDAGASDTMIFSDAWRLRRRGYFVRCRHTQSAYSRRAVCQRPGVGLGWCENPAQRLRYRACCGNRTRN
jgi:hypothetical protein